ncbi:putative gustatory receptor clone PTE03 [Denticeps clupeoides]|uniref:putative gustatory receptor clone PTE03 n=1 Tax=Denticeps clupeoides TaxID=299321 RepID=UPI0010A4F915|nr:putative gustatory receptor clone PTE03 [Denticeps clupeoides]
MQNLSASPSKNSLIHPSGFYIIGFSTLPYTNLYMIFLGVVYLTTVICNCFVIVIIWMERCLHTPKFAAVANLALVDLILSTAVIPSMLKTFLFNDSFIPFSHCLMQMYFYTCFLSMESYSLAVLSFDRFVAICFPLRQHSINSMTCMLCIIGAVWAYCIGRVMFSVIIILNLSFCGSVKVYSYLCDYAPVFRLACNDYSLHYNTATTFSLTNIFVPLSFIIISYMSILITVFRMKSIVSRYKAIATCLEHLILVAIFFIPILTLYIIGFFLFKVDPDLRTLGLSLSSSIPPFVNPIIYSLKTKEIRQKAYILICKIKIHP